MSVNIRYPNITGATDREQLVQIKSFLHQLVEQLNVTLPSLGTGSAQTLNVQGQEVSSSYYELRSLIIQEIQSVEALLSDLAKKLQTEYVSDAELIQTLDAALAAAKENGDFDGPAGPEGETGNGIASIEKTATDGLVDTYTITFTNGSTATFTVTNGERGAQGDPGPAPKISFTLDEDGTLYYELEE